MKIVKLLITTDHLAPMPYSITACSEDRPLFTAYFREMHEVIAAGKALGAPAEVGHASWGLSSAHYVEQMINAQN